jgi:hypothetical protein
MESFKEYTFEQEKHWMEMIKNYPQHDTASPIKRRLFLTLNKDEQEDLKPVLEYIGFKINTKMSTITEKDIILFTSAGYKKLMKTVNKFVFFSSSYTYNCVCFKK